jgi:hypothetical protein
MAAFIIHARAAHVADTLLSADHIGHTDLAAWLDGVARGAGATVVFDRLREAIRASAPVGSAMADALARAGVAAWQFAGEHPEFVTILVLGALVILAPWMLEALGFGAQGPVAGEASDDPCGRADAHERCSGSFAAAWQSRYAGYVPAGSLFSFFQRLGMVGLH